MSKQPYLGYPMMQASETTVVGKRTRAVPVKVPDATPEPQEREPASEPPMEIQMPPGWVMDEFSPSVETFKERQHEAAPPDDARLDYIYQEVIRAQDMIAEVQVHVTAILTILNHPPWYRRLWVWWRAFLGARD